MNFNERLRILRTEAKITQKEVADYLKISQPFYANFETGNKKPNVSHITKLASFFDVSVDYLLGNTDDKHSDNRDLSTFDILFRKTSKDLNEKQQERLKKDLQEFLKQRSEALKEFNKNNEDE